MKTLTLKFSEFEVFFSPITHTHKHTNIKKSILLSYRPVILQQLLQQQRRKTRKANIRD